MRRSFSNVKSSIVCSASCTLRRCARFSSSRALTVCCASSRASLKLRSECRRVSASRLARSTISSFERLAASSTRHSSAFSCSRDMHFWFISCSSFESMATWAFDLCNSLSFEADLATAAFSLNSRSDTLSSRSAFAADSSFSRTCNCSPASSVESRETVGASLRETVGSSEPFCARADSDKREPLASGEPISTADMALPSMTLWASAAICTSKGVRTAAIFRPPRSISSATCPPALLPMTRLIFAMDQERTDSPSTLSRRSPTRTVPSLSAAPPGKTCETTGPASNPPRSGRANAIPIPLPSPSSWDPCGIRMLSLGTGSSLRGVPSRAVAACRPAS